MGGLAFVELFVSDIVAMEGYFTRGLGLASVAKAVTDDQQSTLLRGHGIQVVLTAPRTARCAVADWLDVHGEGVADIAWYHRDVALSAACAAMSGLPVLTPLQPAGGHHMAVVGGIGDLRHTLVDPVHTAPPIAPPARPWRWLPAVEDPQRHLRGIDHLEICVPAGTLETTSALYRHVFGLLDCFTDQVRVGQNRINMQALRYPADAATVLFTEPARDGDDGPAADFLRSNRGAGVRRLAFATADITAAVRTYMVNGVPFAITPTRFYDQLAAQFAGDSSLRSRLQELRQTSVVVADDHGGLLYQATTRSPHPRRTLTYQLVQRDGAAGFGTAALTELWSAIEADLTLMEKDMT